MASAIRNGLQERAMTAERLLEQLRPCILKLKEAAAARRCEKEIAELSASNAKLKQEVEMLVEKLRRAEEVNGVKQVYLSNPKPTSAINPSPPSQSSQSPPAEAPPVPQQKKKPKPKKEAKAPTETDESPVDVSRLLLKVGKIVDVKKHPDADTLYVETVDLAEDRPRIILSGLVKSVPIEQMHGKVAVFACNLKPAKMRGILSEGMIMCASTPDKVQVVDVPSGAVPGDIVTFPDYPGQADKQLNPKKKIWEAIMPDLKTDSEGVATYKGSPFTIAGKGVCHAPGCPNYPIK